MDPTQYGGTKDVIQYLWDLELSVSYGDCKTCGEFETKHPEAYANISTNLIQQKRKLYYGNGKAIVSTFCSGRAVFGGCCLQCLVLSFQRRIRARAAQLAAKPVGTVGTKCNRQHMTVEDVHHRLDDANASLGKGRLEGLNKARGWERCQKRYEKVLRRLKKYSESVINYPKFIRNLQEAFELGQLDGHEALQDILTGISTCLRNGTRRGRTLSDSEKQFYMMLLNNTSPWAHKFVSGVMLGPDLRTSKEFRSRYGGIELGFEEDNVRQLRDTLTKYNLEDTPGKVSEDASGAIRRLDWETIQNSDIALPKTGLKVVGFTGPPVIVQSVEELREIFKNRSTQIANYVYVWVWVPQAPNAPFFPFLVEATDNKFDAGYVWTVWQLLWKWFKKYDLKFCGHISDGDSRLRKNDYRLNVGSETAHWDANSEKCYLLRNGTERHPLLSHHITVTPEGHPVLAHQDWMHLMWRLRLQLIDEKHHFVIGNGDICCAVRDLRSISKECGFKPEDLNWKDKQNWDGCMRIFSQKTLDELMKLIQAGDNRVLPTYAYVSMGYRLLCAWLGEANGATTEQIIHDAAFSLAFVHIWRDWVLDSVHSVKTTFLTRETFLDVVTSCNTRILLFPMYRDHFPKFKPHGPYVSSRFSEYVFQFSRMRQTNNVLVSVRGFMQRQCTRICVNWHWNPRRQLSCLRPDAASHTASSELPPTLCRRIGTLQITRYVI